MTWTKLSDDFAGRPALLSVPRGTRLLHVEALLWSNQYGQNGTVPQYVLARLTDEPDPEKAAAQLVNAGIWGVADDGWQIVDSLDDQPIAEDMERIQQLARARQRRQRQHRNGDHSLCDPRYCHVTRDVTRDSRVTPGKSDSTGTNSPDVTRDSRVSHGSPTRPVPTRPEGTKGRDGGAAARSAGATRAAREGKAHPRCSECANPLAVDDAGWTNSITGDKVCDACYGKAAKRAERQETP